MLTIGHVIFCIIHIYCYKCCYDISHILTRIYSVTMIKPPLGNKEYGLHTILFCNRKLWLKITNNDLLTNG